MALLHQAGVAAPRNAGGELGNRRQRPRRRRRDRGACRDPQRGERCARQRQAHRAIGGCRCQCRRLFVLSNDLRRVERAIQFDALVTAVKGRDQIFAPVLDPGDARAKLAREENQNHVFGRE